LVRVPDAGLCITSKSIGLAATSGRPTTTRWACLQIDQGRDRAQQNRPHHRSLLIRRAAAETLDTPQVVAPKRHFADAARDKPQARAAQKLRVGVLRVNVPLIDTRVKVKRRLARKQLGGAEAELR
jgi:hypothetical protein